MLRHLNTLREAFKARKRGATFQQDTLRTGQYASSRDGIGTTGAAQHQLNDFSYAAGVRFSMPPSGAVITDPRYDGYYHLGLGPQNAIYPITLIGNKINKRYERGVVADQSTGIKLNMHGYPV